MTSPNVVDQVAVEIVADARKLAKSMRQETEKAFKDLDPAKALRDKIRMSKPIKLPVEPEFKDGTRKLPPVRVPVEVDPVLAAFQREIRQQITALARTANAKIPIGADTDGLRTQIGTELASVKRQLKAEVPIEPTGQAEYAARLRAAVEAASARVKSRIALDVDQSGVTRLRDLLRGLFAGVQQAAGVVVSLGSGVASLGSAAGSVLSVVGGIGAISAAASLALPAVAALAGALAALPGAVTGFGAAFATLSLGFKGISDAFKDTGGGGGGGGGGAAGQGRQIAAAARQVEAARRGIAAANRQVEASERSLAAAHRGVEAAELRLVDAQKRARLAQQAISRARVEARESIEDLNRSLKGAKLSEEEAALGVTDALRELEQVKLTGNIPDIQRADIAYRQALQTLEESRDTTEDLQQETDAANKAGVEGSQQVQDAYRDQEEALRAVKDAQVGIIEANDSLKSAQDGVKAAMDGVKSAADGLTSAQEALAQAQTKVASGGGGIAKQLTKLAPAAQRFVAAVKALKPAFEDLRLDVQQRLFEGLDRTVTNLGEAWIPALKETLGRYAETFNGFFRDLGANVSKPQFIEDIQTGAEGARRGLEKIGTAVSGPLVEAFGKLSAAAGPFIEKFGDEIAKVVTEFSKWVIEGEKTGKLQRFFEDASEALGDIFATGKKVTGIVAKIVGIITGESGKGKNDSVIDSFNKELDKISKWLDKPENQQKVKDFIKDVGDLAKKFGEAAKWAAQLVGKVNQIFGGDDQEQPKKPNQPESTSSFQQKGLKFFGWEDGIEPGTSFMDGMTQGLQTGWENLKKLIAGWFWQGPDSLVGRIKRGLGIQSPSTVMIGVGGDLIRGLILGIGNFFGQLRNRASEIKTNIMNRLQGAGQWLRTNGSSAVSGIITGIGDKLGQLRVRATEIKNRVTGALSGAGTWLRTHGVNLVIGLWNGIAERGSWLREKIMAWARANIPEPIRKILGIRSPSRVAMEMGRQIPAGLSIGMQDGARDVAAAAESIAQAALPAMSDASYTLGIDADSAITRNLSVAARSQVEVTVDRRMSGDWLVDGLRRHIVLNHLGNPVAALGG